MAGSRADIKPKKVRTHALERFVSTGSLSARGAMISASILLIYFLFLLLSFLGVNFRDVRIILPRTRRKKMYVSSEVPTVRVASQK